MWSYHHVQEAEKIIQPHKNLTKGQNHSMQNLIGILHGYAIRLVTPSEGGKQSSIFAAHKSVLHVSDWLFQVNT